MKTRKIGVKYLLMVCILCGAVSPIAMVQAAELGDEAKAAIPSVDLNKLQKGSPPITPTTNTEAP